MSDDNKQVLPGHETQSSEMNCPACGRFVGAVTKCPYCKAKVTKRMSLTVTRWAAVFLATVGLFLLYLMAKYRDIPVVLLRDVGPTMNFAQIRVEGTVTRDARPFSNGMGMSFIVNDGTDAITVFTTKKQMDELNTLRMSPKSGDTISLAGSLSFSDDGNTTMRLLSVKEMTLTKAPAALVRLSDINASMKGRAVTVQGRVVELVVPDAASKRPYELLIEDNTGKKALTFWKQEFDEMDDPESWVGQIVLARVSVDTYNKNVQLKLASAHDIEILKDGAISEPEPVKPPAQRAADTYQKEKKEAAPAPAAPARDFSRGRANPVLDIADVTTDMEGDTIRVKGTVRFVNEPKTEKAPYSVILRDGEDSLRVVYWSNVNDVMQDKPATGDVFEWEGTVDVYNNEPQLKVDSGYKVKKLSDAPAKKAFTPKPAAAKDLTALSAITSDLNGQRVDVGAVIKEVRDLNGKGSAYVLEQDGQEIDLIVWNDTLPEKVTKKMVQGATIEARGVQVGEYDGQMQLKAGKFTALRLAP